MTKQVSICLLAFVAIGLIISSTEALKCYSGIDAGTIDTSKTCDIDNGFCIKSTTSANNFRSRGCASVCEAGTVSVDGGDTTSVFCCSITDLCNDSPSTIRRQTSVSAAVLLVAAKFLF